VSAYFLLGCQSWDDIAGIAGVMGIVTNFQYGLIYFHQMEANEIVIN
jgi:hypothetical protein